MTLRHRILFICFCLLFGSVFLGCDKSLSPNYFAFREATFTAEIRGTVGNTDFCATIRLHAPNGSSADGTEHTVTLTYLEPTPFAGLTLSAHTDVWNQADSGSVEIQYQNLTLQGTAKQLSGLFSPAAVLLTANEVSAVQKEANGYRLTLRDGEQLMLNENGIPQAFSSPALSFEVIWWE